MTLRTDYVNDTPSADEHPGAHNTANSAVNALQADLDAAEANIATLTADLAALANRVGWLETASAEGLETMDRRVIVASVGLINQRAVLGYATCRATFTAARIKTVGGTTAAAPTPTLCQMGIWHENADKSLTLIAQTANDTTMFATANAVWERPLDTPVVLTAGQRYAFGVQVNSATTMPHIGVGMSAPPATVQAGTYPPRLTLLYGASVTLPASIPTPNVGTQSFQCPYLVVLP